MSGWNRRGGGPTFRDRWSSWRRLAAPTLFFIGVIYYQELFLKIYCFHGVSPRGALFTLLFTLPVAGLLGLLCGGVSPKRGRPLLLISTALLSVWMGAQSIYYRLFKTFLTVFSLTKMGMVAGAFGDMAMGEIFINWLPVLMMTAPFVLALVFQRRLIQGEGGISRGLGLRWAALAAAVQLASMGIVLCCGGGSLSLRYIYMRAAVPELEVQNFGMLTQNQLELRRVLFGIEPDEQISHKRRAEARSVSEPVQAEPVAYPPEDYHVMDIDFDALAAEETDENLLRMHGYFAQQKPTEKNQWTGYFKGKNLVWIVAEGFCTLAVDPERTPTLYRLTNSGFVFDNFYTPLWGVSTSDGEYTTTTGLIPKSGVWSYSRSSQNYMPFGFGNQFRKLGYRTLAFHDYLYTYYDRDKSFPNMGYEYYALGNGLEMEEVWPPSDLEMMEKIVPMFVNEDRFMVYCLTVSGHLNYSYEENAMSRKHWAAVEDLSYSEGPKAYLACQQELELALESLLDQLSAAGKLEDTVIVLSGDHYPYGLTDEEYSELLGHSVDPAFEIFKNSLILWNAEMEQRVVVEKFCSSLDVMPTLANLFDLEYDSRLMAGRDILSDAPGLVIFSNYSFLTDEGAYDSLRDRFETWSGEEPDSSYILDRISEVQNRVAYSAQILDHDYYRLVLNGPPVEDAPLFSLPRISQPEGGWPD